MGFFSAIKSLGSKVASGASWLGGKVSKVADTVADFADKHAGAIAAVGSALGVPELGVVAKTVGEGARTASNVAGSIKNTADKYLQGNPVG